MKYNYEGMSIGYLFKMLGKFEFEKEIWKRRISNKETKEYNPIMQPKKEYENRIKDCNNQIKDILVELAKQNILVDGVDF